MSICSINDEQESNLMVIWDLGRRCTYSCSYCPPHRRNDWSKIATLDELISTADQLERYSQIYNGYRNKPFRVNTSFTGGEPTVNPVFFDFLEYLDSKYPHWKRTLTSNGFYSERKLRTVMATTDFTTISYHCEATEAQKQMVKRNLEIMKSEGYGCKVNVMFHADPVYFKECIDLCSWLDSLNISYTPRVIGDQGEIKEGIKDKTVHTYEDWQMQWFKDYWKVKENNTKKQDDKTIGQTLGRPCCGGRLMTTKTDSGVTEQTKFIINNNFEGWNCMINWYFLYIHQEVDAIWHHQTCQVNMDGEIGPITSITDFSSYNDRLEINMAGGTIPYIRCPKTHCGCGLCVPKAAGDGDAFALFNSHTSNIKPILMQKKSIFGRGTLKSVVELYDSKIGKQ